MSKLLKILYDVAEIRSRYHRVHEETVGFSARKFLRPVSRSAPNGGTSLLEELDRLLPRLLSAQHELHDLKDEDLSVRRGREIRNVLAAYVQALTESCTSLKVLCECEQGSENAQGGRARKRLTDLKVAYDDAVQHRKHLGARLNQLISTL